MLRLLLLAFVAGVTAAFFAFGWHHAFELSSLRANAAALARAKAERPVLAAALYLLVYIGVTGLSLPGAVPLTLAAGALFGLEEGTLLVSFGSTIGATLAFLASRFLFQDLVRRRFAPQLAQINRGLERRGTAYLLTLRLVPVVPFVAVNLLLGLTSFPATRFYWVSQLGMLPATIVYVNAGTQLGNLTSVSGILSPAVIASLVLLALLPLVGHALKKYLV